MFMKTVRNLCFLVVLMLLVGACHSNDEKRTYRFTVGNGKSGYRQCCGSPVLFLWIGMVPARICGFAFLRKIQTKIWKEPLCDDPCRASRKDHDRKRRMGAKYTGGICGAVSYTHLIAAIRSYFTDEQVIRSIAGYAGMDFDTLIGGDYKLVVEPVSYTHLMFNYAG